MTWRIIEGDCLVSMAAMDAACVDAVVCDPPYGLEFMGKEWDKLGGDGRQRGDATFVEGDRRHGLVRHGGAGYGQDAAKAGRAMQAWHEAWAREALRVLKPGGHLLAFGGSRTYHRLACAIEDAGFEVRDCLMWLYGSGFPKSLNLDGEWQGWGTALKPAHEPIVLARKPLAGTVAATVLAHGTGALNVDGCRIGTDGEVLGTPQSDPAKRAGVVGRDLGISSADAGAFRAAQAASIERTNTLGRWPANVILDPGAGAMLDVQSGEAGAAAPASGPTHEGHSKSGSMAGEFLGMGDRPPAFHADSGGASRFFYCAKTDSAERHMQGQVANTHPTVKPIALMRWLCRLVTPPGGLVLDPFAGSGTTGIAALREGFSFVGCEREPEYIELARERIRLDAPLMNTMTEAA